MKNIFPRKNNGFQSPGMKMDKENIHNNAWSMKSPSPRKNSVKKLGNSNILGGLTPNSPMKSPSPWKNDKNNISHDNNTPSMEFITPSSSRRSLAWGGEEGEIDNEIDMETHNDINNDIGNNKLLRESCAFTDDVLGSPDPLSTYNHNNIMMQQQMQQKSISTKPDMLMESPDPMSKYYDGPGALRVASSVTGTPSPYFTRNNNNSHGKSKHAVPLIYGSNVVMESPDPMSKFHEGPGALCTAIPSARSPIVKHRSNNTSSSSNSQAVPPIYGNNVVMVSPDVMSKFHEGPNGLRVSERAFDSPQVNKRGHHGGIPISPSTSMMYRSSSSPSVITSSSNSNHCSYNNDKSKDDTDINNARAGSIGRGYRALVRQILSKDDINDHEVNNHSSNSSSGDDNVHAWRTFDLDVEGTSNRVTGLQRQTHESNANPNSDHVRVRVEGSPIEGFTSHAPTISPDESQPCRPRRPQPPAPPQVGQSNSQKSGGVSANPNPRARRHAAYRHQTTNSDNEGSNTSNAWSSPSNDHHRQIDVAEDFKSAVFDVIHVDNSDTNIVDDKDIDKDMTYRQISPTSTATLSPTMTQREDMTDEIPDTEEGVEIKEVEVIAEEAVEVEVETNSDVVKEVEIVHPKLQAQEREEEKHDKNDSSSNDNSSVEINNDNSSHSHTGSPSFRRKDGNNNGKVLRRRMHRVRPQFTPNLETISEATRDEEGRRSRGKEGMSITKSIGLFGVGLGFPSWIDRCSPFRKCILSPARDFDNDPYRLWMSNQCVPHAHDSDMCNIQHNGDAAPHIVFDYLYNRDFPNLKKCLEDPHVLYEMDAIGNTPLLVAARMGFKKVIRYMVKKASTTARGIKGTLDVQNSMGNTALHFAREFDAFEIITFLLKKGASEKIVNTIGNTYIERVCDLVAMDNGVDDMSEVPTVE